MNEIREQLLTMARDKYRNILPIPRLKKIENCFTEDFGKTIFWFNTADKSTHLISYDIHLKTFRVNGKNIMTQQKMTTTAKKIVNAIINPTKSKLSKYKTKKVLLTNTEYAKTDQKFKSYCEVQNIEPTGRQVGKYRRKKGLAFQAKNIIKR